MADEKVLRAPVTHQWQALNWDFLKCLAEIAHYAAGKYGSAEQYINGRLEGEKSPVNHMYEHLREFQAGELHDHFGTLEHQLAAVAYGAMMEYAYVKMYGHAPNKVMAASRGALKQTGIQAVVERQLAEGRALRDGEGGVVPVNTLGAVVDGKFVAAPLPKMETDWAEGLSHFKARWTDGFAGARDPKSHLRWKAMLWVLDQFDEVARTDDVILPLIEDIRDAALAAMVNLKTPENIEEQQAKIAALDTLRSKIPGMFQMKAVAK